MPQPPCVLILSSWVAHGHVGLSAAAPVLQALGARVSQLPTTMLSNHPGWPFVAGQPVPVSQLAAMQDALAKNAFLRDVSALLIGYLPTPEHVDFAVELAARVRSQGRPKIIIDPVLGDLPNGLYLPEAVAHRIRNRLISFADILTPNLFELGWLARGSTPCANATIAAARGLGLPSVLVTSAPAGHDRTGVIEVSRSSVCRWSTPREQDVPKGVGDVFSALIAGGLPTGAAVGHLDALIRASLGAPHLQIAEAAQIWRAAQPLAPEPEKTNGL